MTFTTEDLREVLRREGGNPRNPDRLAQIEARITRRKRRRVGAAAVGVAMAAAASTVALWPDGQDRTQPASPPSVPLRSVSLSWPEAKKREVTVPVERGFLNVRGMCMTDDPTRPVAVAIKINGIFSMPLGCKRRESGPSWLNGVPPRARSVRVTFELTAEPWTTSRTDWHLTVYAEKKRPLPKIPSPVQPLLASRSVVAKATGTWPTHREATLTVPYRGRRLWAVRVCEGTSAEQFQIGLSVRERSVAVGACQNWPLELAPLKAVEIDPRTHEAKFTLRIRAAETGPLLEGLLVDWGVIVLEDK